MVAVCIYVLVNTVILYLSYMLLFDCYMTSKIFWKERKMCYNYCSYHRVYTDFHGTLFRRHCYCFIVSLFIFFFPASSSLNYVLQRYYQSQDTGHHDLIGHYCWVLQRRYRTLYCKQKCYKLLYTRHFGFLCTIYCSINVMTVLLWAFVSFMFIEMVCLWSIWSHHKLRSQTI
jgi:hypothetical protein